MLKTTIIREKDFYHAGGRLTIDDGLMQNTEPQTRNPKL